MLRADRNLLFGILALQMDFVTRDALIAAMHAWVLDKAKPLGQILLQQGTLASERLDLLEALVAEHLKAHQNDPQHSLAALSSLSSVRKELDSIGDDELQASIGIVGSGCNGGPGSTIDEVKSPGCATASCGRMPKVASGFNSEDDGRETLKPGQRGTSRSFETEGENHEKGTRKQHLACVRRRCWS
jgi:hypothetical protein